MLAATETIKMKRATAYLSETQIMVEEFKLGNERSSAAIKGCAADYYGICYQRM